MTQIAVSDRIRLVISGGSIKAVFDFRDGCFDGEAELRGLLARDGLTLEDIIERIREETETNGEPR